MTPGRRFRNTAILAGLLTATATPAIAQIQFETIHEFTQGPGSVHGRLVQAADGNLYGVAAVGGVYGGGTAFVIRRVAGEWTPAVTLHDFRAAEGTAPVGGLIEASPGILLGTTASNGAFGGGTIFRLSVAGAFQVLASFNPAVHGAGPIAELTRGVDLNFYGTTPGGGAGGRGTVFRLTPSGALTVMHAFAGPDGATPTGALAVGLDGHFYGSTYAGGAENAGTVFRMTRLGAFTQLHSFRSRFGMKHPTGRVTLGQDGALYGAVPGFDCSIVCANPGLFRVALDGTVALRPSSWSGGPGTGVVAAPDGWLYGTRDGGAQVYRVRPGIPPPGESQEENVVPPFPPHATGYGGFATLLLADDGRFYKGTSLAGTGGYGTVFSASSSGDVRVVHSFSSEGFHPTGTLLRGQDGALFGSTYAGGREPFGTVFALHPGLAFETLADFPSGHGNPLGDLLTYGSGMLLPTTARIMTYVNGAFTMLSQSTPVGSPAVAGDGTVYAANMVEQIVRADTEQLVYQFPFGTVPTGLIESEGVLYGVTRSGGVHGRGTVFSLTLDGTLTTLHHFSGPDGQWPFAALAVTSDGTLVGTTVAGGDTSASSEGNGTIFKVARDGSSFATLHAFGPGEGRQPIARLTDAGGGVFFGTTFSGGAGFGTVFAVSLDGAFGTVHTFVPGQGALPYGGVTFGSDGALYGTTVVGGRGNVGTIFAIRGLPLR
jgi:uncharacterized repeat protein (TIGR03803 family)